MPLFPCPARAADNLWRLLYVANGGDGDAVRALQEGMQSSGQLTIPSAAREWIGQRVRTVAVSDEETLSTLRHVHAATGGGLVLDPHTAVGVAAALRSPFRIPAAPPSPATPPSPAVVCLGCAHAVKFLPAVARALSLSLEQALGCLPELTVHPCVRSVGAMAQRLQLAPSTEAERSNPPGCVAVLRRGEAWEARLRQIITSAAAPASRL